MSGSGGLAIHPVLVPVPVVPHREAVATRRPGRRGPSRTTRPLPGFLGSWDSLALIVVLEGVRHRRSGPVRLCLSEEIPSVTACCKGRVVPDTTVHRKEDLNPRPILCHAGRR